MFNKKHKNNQKIRKSLGTVRRNKIELVRLSSVRFGSKIYLSSIVSLYTQLNACLYSYSFKIKNINKYTIEIRKNPFINVRLLYFTWRHELSMGRGLTIRKLFLPTPCLK